MKLADPKPESRMLMSGSSETKNENKEQGRGSSRNQSNDELIDEIETWTHHPSFVGNPLIQEIYITSKTTCRRKV